MSCCFSAALCSRVDRLAFQHRFDALPVCGIPVGETLARGKKNRPLGTGAVLCTGLSMCCFVILAFDLMHAFASGLFAGLRRRQTDETDRQTDIMIQ